MEENMNDLDKALRDLVSEFKKFHAKNPEVYSLFCKFTFQAINSGHVRLLLPCCERPKREEPELGGWACRSFPLAPAYCPCGQGTKRGVDCRQT